MKSSTGLLYLPFYLLLQFVEALTTGKKSLSLDEPLTDEDCQFLRSIFVPAFKNRSILSLPKNFDEEKSQGYAIVLKIISGKILPVCSIEYIFSGFFFYINIFLSTVQYLPFCYSGKIRIEWTNQEKSHGNIIVIKWG